MINYYKKYTKYKKKYLDLKKIKGGSKLFSYIENLYNNQFKLLKLIKVNKVNKINKNINV